MKIQLFKLKKSGRVCYPFPWESKSSPCPWNPAYQRVIIPFTAAETKNARNGKRTHIQIVHSSNLEKVSESRLTLR